MCYYFVLFLQFLAFKVSENKSDLEALPRSVVLENLSDGWWSHDLAANTARISEFLNWLAGSPLTRIAVFCHWGVVRQFLDLLQYRQTLEILNAIPISVRFAPHEIIPSHREYSVRLQPSLTDRRNIENLLLRQLAEFYDECRSHLELQTSTELGPPHITLVEFWPLSPDHLQQVRQKMSEYRTMLESLDPEDGNFWKISNNNVSINVQSDKALFVTVKIQNDQQPQSSIGQLQNLLSLMKSLDCYKATNVVRSSFHVSILRDDKPEGKSLKIEEFSKVSAKYPLVHQMFFPLPNGDAGNWRQHFENIVWNLSILSKEGEHMDFPLYKKIK